MENIKTKPVRMDIALVKTLEKFILDYKNKTGIDITFVQSTSLLNKKIENIGGLRV